MWEYREILYHIKPGFFRAVCTDQSEAAGTGV